MKNYGEIAEYWDIIQETKTDYQGEALSLHKIFQENKIKSVLETACGTGSHLLHLARLGYECTGMDISDKMLEKAKKKFELEGLASDFCVMDMGNIKVSKQYDAVICLYAMTFLPETQDLERALKNIYEVLNFRGLVVFNVLNSEYKPSSSMPMSFSPLDSIIDRGTIKIVRLNRAQRIKNKQKWDAVYLIEDEGKTSIHIQHNELTLFQFENLEKIFNECGFKINSAYGNLVRLEKLRDDSFDIFVIASKEE